jgi:hypothetical protein
MSDQPENAPPAKARVDLPKDGGPDSREAHPREIGGRGGLDPTRYGDWEKNGRCIDF